MPKFYATYANRQGQIFDDPGHEFVACSAHHVVRPHERDMIPLPQGSKFFTLPGYGPFGWNDELEETVFLSDPVDDSLSVSAFLPPGYTRLYLPATNYRKGSSPLPLWSYTALAWRGNRFWVPAVKVDDDRHWQPSKYDDRGIDRRIDRKRERLNGNRLVEQLAVCAKDFHCFAAKNFFYERWECPLPVSPGCNSNCIGCISKQPSGKYSASMERLKFVPTVEEISDLALDHLRRAPEAFVSFGQGCEGDPLMQYEVIEKAIRRIKREMPDATVNLNTNAAKPEAVQRLIDAGLDSIRVSLNSAIPAKYERYYRPDDYSFSDVVTSIKTASDAGLFINLNLLVFPGISDQEEEIAALYSLIRANGIHRIQMKNLCIDPHIYLETVGYPDGPGIGIRPMMESLKREFSDLQFGYFNLPRSKFFSSRQYV